MFPDRDKILREGGLPKWQRTRRQVMLVNKPDSMFLGTHMLSSGKVLDLQKEEQRFDVSLEDIGFNKKYDETLLNPSLLGGISQM